jgi:penicillin-binding protein 2
MNHYVTPTDNDWVKQRIVGLSLGALVVFIVLLARLAYLQAVVGEDYQRLSVNNSIRLQIIDPPRGLILDANGVKLAENRPSFDVAFTPKDAGDAPGVLEALAAYLRVPADDFSSRVRDTRGLGAFRPVLLRQDIGRDALAVVEARKMDLPGVQVDVRIRRNYIHGAFAAHLIGYLGEVSPEELSRGAPMGLRGGDTIGKFGVERTFDAFLRGEPGGRQVEVNASGQVMRVLNTVAAQPGRNLHLTIDHALQQRAEQLLEGIAGAAVAVDPQNGRILAMASSPPFPPTARWRTRPPRASTLPGRLSKSSRPLPGSKKKSSTKAACLTAPAMYPSPVGTTAAGKRKGMAVWTSTVRWRSPATCSSTGSGSASGSTASPGTPRPADWVRAPGSGSSRSPAG